MFSSLIFFFVIYIITCNIAQRKQDYDLENISSNKKNPQRFISSLDMIKRKVLIVPEAYPININNDFDVVYNQLDIAFSNESIQALNNNENLDLYIYLLNYTYNLYNNKPSVYFRYFQGNLTIGSLLCSNIEVFGCFTDVYLNYGDIIINLSNFEIIFYISGNLLINHITFDGNNALYNLTCPLSLCNRIKQISEKTVFFEIETNSSGMTIPFFSLIYVKFMNFYAFNSSASQTYLIYNKVSANFLINNLIIENCYFPLGLFYYQNITSSPSQNHFFMNFSNIFISYYNNKRQSVCRLDYFSEYFNKFSIFNKNILYFLFF